MEVVVTTGTISRASSSQIITTNKITSSFFYRPDDLPVAQRTVVAMPLISPLMPVPQRIEALYSFYLKRNIRARNWYVYRSPDIRSSSFTTLRLQQITSPRAVVHGVGDVDFRS